MQSQSTLMSSAAESRFRIEAPNSQPRTLVVVALDAVAAAWVKELAEHAWRNASFFSLGPERGTASGFGALHLVDPDGRTADLVDTVAGADMVELVTSAGQHGEAGTLIGELCALKGVKASGIIIDDGRDPAALSRELAELRRWVVTLSVISSSADIDEVLRALGA